MNNEQRAAMSKLTWTPKRKPINTELVHKAHKRSARAQQFAGVHWGWWVFWSLFFWPALIVVAILHNGKKSNAIALAALNSK